MIHKALIYGVSIVKGELFIIQCGEVIFSQANSLITKSSNFYEKYTWKREG